jgi:LmbE family N-acetylglucosaminyl deacetylase
VIPRSVLVATLLLPAAVMAVTAVTAQEPALLTLAPVRALVISPHPDDATLAAGGLMQRILQQGGTVRVVQMTDGDAFPQGVVALKPGLHPSSPVYRWYGSLRERESIHALRQIGVHRSQIRLLGFPDEGLCRLASAGRTTPAFLSPYTDRESPPASEQIVPGTMFRRDDLLRELTRLIQDVRPTLVVLPHAGDEHPDHCATHLLVHEAVSDAVADGLHMPRVLHYILHYPGWPASSNGHAPIEPPGGRAQEWQWLTLPLTPAEQTIKQRALNAYRSQTLVMLDFFKSFERSNELFIEGEPLAPFPCWCAGDNISPAAGRHQ